MNTRPVPLASARSGRSFSFLFLALALGTLSACSDGEPKPRPVLANPGMARLEVLGTHAEPGEELRFRCAADDPQGDLLTYQFDWGDDGDVTPAPEAVPSGTAVELAHVFLREGAFQARCRAVDAEGNEGPWSIGASYSIQAPQPGEGRTEVNVEVLGQGKVSSAPTRLSCPENCRGWFDSDAEVTLTATPEVGWRFVGWWGAFCEGRGSASYTFTLTTPMRCVARFAPETELSADAWQRTGARLPASPVWSPDGTRLAALDSSLSVGSRLRIWDAASGKLVRAIRTSSDVFNVVAWSPRGDVVAVGRTGGGIALLDPTTGRTVREWKGHSGSVRALAWSPDGRRLASGDNRDALVRLWNADTGEPAGASLSTAHMPQRLTWSPDGSRLAVESGIRHSSTQWWVEIHHLALARPEQLLTEVASFVWSPDGTRYAVGDEHEVRVYVTATHALQATWSGTSGTAHALDWSPDGRWLGVGDMVGPLVVLEAESGVEVARATVEIPGQEPRRYEALRFHPSLPAFVAVEPFPGAVDIFTVDAAAHTVSRREMLPHFSRVDAVAWSPAGDRLASAGDEGLVRLWDGQGMAVLALSGHGGKALRTLGWDGGCARLASGGVDGKACIWRAEDGALLRFIQHGTGYERQPIEVHRVALSPDGRRLATLSGVNPASALTATVRVWDVDSGAEVFRFPERSRSVRALTWTPDGRYVLAVSSDISWELWDSQTGEVRLVDPGVEFTTQAAALSPDGTRLAIAREPAGLSIHDLLTGEQRAVAHEGFEPYALAWSPDGRHIAGGGVGGLVFTWEVGAGLASTVVGFHECNVSAVSWRPDGRALTTGGTDAAVGTWRFGAR